MAFDYFVNAKNIAIVFVGLHLIAEWVIDACTSSRVRPLVSGTSFATNTTPKPLIPENMRNVPEIAMPKHACPYKYYRR